MKKKITRDDILDLSEFEKVRLQRRQEILGLKRKRRIALGPDATIFFESYDTMWWQVHEMLRIEKGGEEQIADELAAFNPLIPQGNELVATMMIEIGDAQRRAEVLAGLGGIEDSLKIRFAGHEVTGQAEDDIDRTTADGKASSVQFIHFIFTPEQVVDFCSESLDVVIECNHPNYLHKAILPNDTHAELMKDFCETDSSC